MTFVIFTYESDSEHPQEKELTLFLKNIFILRSIDVRAIKLFNTLIYSQDYACQMSVKNSTTNVETMYYLLTSQKK